MNKNSVVTDDMYFAAALLSYGAELISIDKTNKRRQKFEFFGDIKSILVSASNGFYLVIDSPSFDEVRHKYNSKRLFFPPNYHDSIRSIKSSIHV